MNSVRRAARPGTLFAFFLLFFLGLLAISTPITAQAEDFRSRVLVNGALRQLRAVQVRVNGYSILSRSAPPSRQRVSALHHARQKAVETVREALDQEISRRGLNVKFFFPAKAEADAVYQLSSQDVPPQGDTPFGVSLLADVVYVLELAPRGGRKKAGLSDNTLKMTPTDQPSAAPSRKQLQNDFARAMDSLDKALKARMEGEKETQEADPNKPDAEPPLPMTPASRPNSD